MTINECPFCEKIFIRKDHLQKHIIICHQEKLNNEEKDLPATEKEFKEFTRYLVCPICLQKVFGRDNYVSHLKSVHKVKTNSVCDMVSLQLNVNICEVMDSIVPALYASRSEFIRTAIRNQIDKDLMFLRLQAGVDENGKKEKKI